MNGKLSSHDHGNCELCEQIESELIEAKREIGLLERENEALKLLLTAYRVGEQRLADKALTKLDAITREREQAQ